MIMVSIIAVCQYPISKKIGNDSVVIMTMQQARDISDRFYLMSDSIKLLKQNFQRDLNREMFNCNFLLKKANDSIVEINKRNILTAGEIGRAHV